MGFYLFCFLPLHEVHTPDLIWVSKYYLLWKCNKNINNLSMTFAVRLFLQALDPWFYFINNCCQWLIDTMQQINATKQFYYSTGIEQSYTHLHTLHWLNYEPSSGKLHLKLIYKNVFLILLFVYSFSSILTFEYFNNIWVF